MYVGVFSSLQEVLLLLFLCVKDRVAVATLHMLVDMTKMGRSFQDRQDGQLNLTFAILAIFVIIIIISVDGNSGEVTICWWV